MIIRVPLLPFFPLSPFLPPVFLMSSLDNPFQRDDSWEQGGRPPQSEGHAYLDPQGLCQPLVCTRLSDVNKSWLLHMCHGDGFEVPIPVWPRDQCAAVDGVAMWTELPNCLRYLPSWYRSMSWNKHLQVWYINKAAILSHPSPEWQNEESSWLCYHLDMETGKMRKKQNTAGDGCVYKQTWKVIAYGIAKFQSLQNCQSYENYTDVWIMQFLEKEQQTVLVSWNITIP